LYIWITLWQTHPGWNLVLNRRFLYICIICFSQQRLLCVWSYGSWIYNYPCKQYLSPLSLWVWIPIMARFTRYNFICKVCQWLTTGQWFSLISSTNKTDCHDMTEILLKVALNTITLTLLFCTCLHLCMLTISQKSFTQLEPHLVEKLFSPQIIVWF
jgi:hypothetical protein